MVAFRLSQEDFSHFEEKLLTSQMTRSAFFREVFLQANVNLTVQSLPSKELGHLMFLYNKASNNLNQIAHQVNIAHLTQKVSERLYRQVNNGLIDIRELLLSGVHDVN
uniref:Relaxosome component n=1 Tax=Arsenophonus nasoniae TaxID=638 RepID=D2U0X4_9GAMM|nr:relaxosome component [Arsenophonus nasoniae]